MKKKGYINMKKYYCVDCKITEISYNTFHYGKKHCIFCANKGINNPNYIDNRTNKKYYCKVCKKEISITAGLYGKSLCHSCENKRRHNLGIINFPKGNKHHMFGKHFTNEQKRILSLSHGGTGIPYENNIYPQKFHEIRKEIIIRDNYICQLCNKYGKEVHHIDYNKNNNNKNNLITLCRKCNMKANYNKNKWIDYFKEILK